MTPRSFRFAAFTLDLDRLCLRSPSGEMKLRPKTFEVLQYLIENARRVVTKDEVIKAVWSGVTVTEESLTRCISEVRRALGDEAQEIVKTIPKRGYVFDLPVYPDEAKGLAAPGDEEPPAGAGSASAPVRGPVRGPVPAPVPGDQANPAGRPRDGQRGQLTVMVCNIVDLAMLARRLDPEDLREVLAAIYGCARRVIGRHGGFVARQLADGVMAYFGYPQAREDDPERAVRAALALMQAVGELKIELLSKRLEARIGVATGLVLVGDDQAEDHAPIGETPLLAAHLANVAAPGTVVVSGPTRRIVGGLFECLPLSVDVNATDTIAASVVLREGGIASRFEALRGPDASTLVGRGEELEFLLRRWEQAKSGKGRVVLLTGDGGIGKSRIARALQDRLAGQPHVALVYHCMPHHRETALHPIITQFMRAAGIRRTDPAEVKLGKLELSLEYSSRPPDEHISLFAALLAIPGGERYRLPDLAPQDMKERTLGALVDLLRRHCAAKPVFALFEDLHWIDPTSLELLTQVVEEASDLPLLLVGTARPEFAPPWPNHWHTAAMPLTRLGPSDVETLIGSVTRGKALPAEVVAQIVARTDGVPLFIEELTKSILESGMLRDLGGRYELTGELPLRSIPSTLHASLLARLDRLPSVKGIAQVGAAIGEEFSYGLMSAVSDLPEHELNAALAQLVAAELIFQRGEPPDATYRFKHTLVHDAAYDSLPRAPRRQLHARIAGVIEDKFPNLVATAPGTLAHHYAEAVIPDKAASYWTKAGRLSLERSAMVEASAQLERALKLLAEVPETTARRKQEIDLRLMLFRAYLTRGEIGPMTATLMGAVETAKTLGDERRLALATAQLAMAQWIQGDHVAAAGSARFVLEHAQRSDDVPLQIFGKHTLANAEHGQGRLKEAISLHRQVIDALAQHGLENQRLGWAGLPSVMSRAFLGWFLIEAGQFDDARREIEAGCALADAVKQPYSHVLIHAGEGLYHLRRGYPERAVPILEPTLKLCQRVFTMEAMLAGWLGTALVQTGRPADALAVTQGSFRRRAHLAGGMYTWFYLFKAIGEAHAALGDAGEALAWADKAIQVTRDAQESLHYAQGLKSRGDIRLQLSLRTEAAVDDLEEARQIAEQRGLLPLVAECDLSLARALGRLGRSAQARRLASRAAQAFLALGLERRVAEAESLTA
jgi:DNA-binding winged helix-turn-helix (wHTH) protein/class 3 adenylate cyclase/tetratricopeptide (TPR) repeat protein